MLAALVYCESSFREDAVSSVGAIGLMQIMPDTGEWLATKVELSEALIPRSPCTTRRRTCAWDAGT